MENKIIEMEQKVVNDDLEEKRKDAAFKIRQLKKKLGFLNKKVSKNDRRETQINPNELAQDDG